jgi:hypothetical protein
MAERIRQDSRLGREGPRPAASPVDTFVQPARESNLISLAESLKDLSPAVGNLAVALRQNKLERDAERDAAEVSQAMSEGATAAEALERRNSAAAKKQAAQLSAFNYGAALNTFVTEQLQDETELPEFNRKIDEFTRQWKEQNAPAGDGAFIRGFEPQAAAIRQNLVQQMSWRVGERKRQQTEQDFGLLVGKAVQQEMDTTRSEGRQERAVGAINALRQQAFDMGIRGSRINTLIFENISSIGVADGRPELVNLLFDAPTGTDGTAKLGDIPEFREKIARASIQAESNANRREVSDLNKKKQDSDKILGDMQTALIEHVAAGQDPASFNILEYARLMNRVDPTRVNDLEAARGAFSRGFNRSTEPVIENQLTARVFGTEDRLSKPDLLEYLKNGQIGADTFRRLYGDIERRDRIRATRQGPTLEALSSGGRRIISDALNAVGLEPDDTRIIRGEMYVKLNKQFSEWLDSEEGKAASPTDAREYARGLAEILIDEFNEQTRQQQDKLKAEAAARDSANTNRRRK